MTFIRGDRRCFDRWRALGNAGWGYDDVLPLFKRLEDNETRRRPSIAAADGPLAVSDCFDPHAGAPRVSRRPRVDTASRPTRASTSASRMPRTCAGYYQKNILDGRRHSAADAFLVPALTRPNLDGALRRAQATKLDRRGHARRRRRSTCATAGAKQARAAREVVLCGGVVDRRSC